MDAKTAPAQSPQGSAATIYTFPPEGFDAEEHVGRGSFSDIWRIRERTTGRPYALKQLRPGWRSDTTARHFLEHEARVGLAVRSQHIVRVEQAVADGEGLWLVLEWLDGITLERKLAESPRLPLATTVWIARQCAQGLEDLAEAGFVHGDVKPANIFVTSTGQVKLIDLGFAWPVRDRATSSQRNLAGTVEYMAPEVLAGDRSQPVAADVYSLGITLFRMLAGRLPFENGTAAGVLRLQRQAKPPDLRRICPQAPVELCALVARMLAKQPVRRPSRHADVVRALIELELQLLAHHSDAA